MPLLKSGRTERRTLTACLIVFLSTQVVTQQASMASSYMDSTLREATEIENITTFLTTTDEMSDENRIANICYAAVNTATSEEVILERRQTFDLFMNGVSLLKMGVHEEMLAK
jgi:hypothetical protein